MTLIPVNINQASRKHNLARAIEAMRSVTVPSPASLLIAASGNDAAIPAQTKAIGIPGYYAAFDLSPNSADPTKTDFKAELPYSQKIFNARRSMRRALTILSSLAANMEAVATPVAIATPAPNLETYLYDQANALAATTFPGQIINFDRQSDPLTGRTYVKIWGTLDGSIEELLFDRSLVEVGGD
jgi:hypothetical protein